MSKKELYTLRGLITGDTDKAVRIDFGKDEVWFPHDAVEMEEVGLGYVDVTMTRAWVEKKGLEAYV